MIPQINMKKTGENIKRLMNNRGLSVRAVQEVCGFATPQAIYKWLHGKSLPTVDNLVILADLFCCTIDDILIVEKEYTF